MEKLYGTSTKKAIKNFDISGYTMPKIFIKNLIEIKKASAIANNKLNKIDDNKLKAITKACDKLLKSGLTKEQFPVDVFQTGSGTSTNMNANEVIATLASQYFKKEIHPNDDIN
jgi:fumarate hydratase class II